MTLRSPVLHLFVASKEALLSLFDLLNLNQKTVNTTKANVAEIRKFLTSILGKLAEDGLLSSAVKRFDVRSSAIGAIAAACLMEEDNVKSKKKKKKKSTSRYHLNDDSDDDEDDTYTEDHDEDEEEEDMTSNSLSSGLMKCLVELCTVKDSSSKNKSNKKRISLSSTEAEAIATNLGKKICHMVLSRFLERAKLQQYEMEEDEEIMDAPDVAMLCAVAQHPPALKILRSIGGLAALSQIASEGELSALLALKKACEDDASVLLESDTYLSIMALFSEENDHASWRSDPAHRRQLEAVSFQLLGQLCGSSLKGRKLVANSGKCDECASKAIEVVISMIETSPPPPYPFAPSAPSAPEEEDSSDDEVNVNNDGDNDDDNSSDNDEGDNSSNGDDEDGEDNDDDKEDKPVAVLPPPLPPVLLPPMEPAVDDAPPELVNMEEADLAISCLTFLSAVVPVANVRKDMLSNETFIKAASALATAGALHNRELQFEAVKLYKCLAPYVGIDDSDGVVALSLERMANILHSVLEGESGAAFSAPGKLNANLLHSTAVVGIQMIFDNLEIDTQLGITKTMISRFAKLVKTFTAARTGVEKDRQNGGELACNVLITLLLARGKPAPVQDLFYTRQVLLSLINVVQWRYDPKTKIDESNASEVKNKLYWNASVTHCLQILSSTLWSTKFTIMNAKQKQLASSDKNKAGKKKKNAAVAKNNDDGISFSELAKSVLMVARPGKAPRKAIDVNSALTRIIESAEKQAPQPSGVVSDAAAVIAAQRIMDRLF